MYHCDDNPFFAESEFACEFASGLGPHRKKSDCKACWEEFKQEIVILLATFTLAEPSSWFESNGVTIFCHKKGLKSQKKIESSFTFDTFKLFFPKLFF